MSGKTCFFIGHRNAPEALGPLLGESIERHISQYGVTSFTVGDYGSFDRLVTVALQGAKARHPEILLWLLLAYHPYQRTIPVPACFEGTFYPPGLERVPQRLAIVRANEYMIRHSDYLICFDRGWPGNTRELVEKARRLQGKGRLQIENLAVEKV